MRRRKNKKTIFLVLQLALVLLISIGYAAISTTLNVNGRTTIKKQNWSVYFTNIRTTLDSITPVTAPTTSGTSTTSLTWELNMDEPGQFYEFTVDVVNDGSLDAMIGEIEDTTLSEEQARYLNYSVTYFDGAEIAKYDSLVAGEIVTLKVRVEYRTDIDPEDLPETSDQISLTYNLNYVQADNNAKLRAISSLNVRLRELDTNYFDNWCPTESTIQLSIGSGYADATDYYINRRADLSTKERLFCSLYTIFIGWDELTDLPQIIENGHNTLADNNTTLSEYCLDNGISLENFTYSAINTLMDLALKPLAIAGVLDEEEEISRIIDFWNENLANEYGNISSIDDIFALGDTPLTLEQAANYCGVSTNILVDFIFQNTVYTDNTELQNDMPRLQNKLAQIQNEYETIAAQIPDGIYYKLPGSDTEEEYTSSINYPVSENGTYTFAVIYNDEETEYSVDVTGIGHKELNYSYNDYTYNGNGTHTHRYPCYYCNEWFEETEECSPDTETPIDVVDNGDGTHSDHYTCICGAEYIADPQEHDGSDSGNCVDNGDGTHSYHCHCEACNTDYESDPESHDYDAGYYADNEDGTHSYYFTCYTCGAEDISDPEGHTDNGNGSYTDNGNGTHSYYYYCSDCGAEVVLDPEPHNDDGTGYCQDCGAHINHEDNDEDGFCDECGETM